MCEELGILLPVQLTLCWPGKQAEVCGGGLRLSWKVGQTVGTFLWPCFCKVGKERGGGDIKLPAFFHTVARGSVSSVQFSYAVPLVTIIFSQYLC